MFGMKEILLMKLISLKALLILAIDFFIKYNVLKYNINNILEYKLKYFKY